MIEVLVAATIFMIGFAVTISLLNQLIGGYSSKDQVIGYQLAINCMEQTLSSGEYVSKKEISTKSNISFIVDQKIEQQGNLYLIRIEVSRAKTRKLLASLYSEKYIR